MALDLTRIFSDAALQLRASEIRELLKLLDRPEMISFAGGLPNPAAFPIDGLGQVIAHVMRSHPAEALQYGPTEGHYRLRNALARGMGRHYGAPQQPENILITNGAQQALHLLASIVLNPGDLVLTARPTYLGALLVFRTLRAQVEPVYTDADGMVPEALEAYLRAPGTDSRRAKMLYLVPTFDNPTSATMPAERRRALYDLACRHDLLIVEDDPYGLLRYEGQAVAPIKSLDEEGRVAYLGSFSKILAPGFRIGWMAASPELTRKAVLAKQAFDLCSNTFGQYCVYEAMRHDLLFPHIEQIKAIYRRKRDLMLTAVQQLLPGEVRYNRPDGGLFLWLELPSLVDATPLLAKAIESNVAYVPGRPFFPDDTGHNTLRINFSYAEDGAIVEGVRRLSAVISAALAVQGDGDQSDQVGIF